MNSLLRSVPPCRMPPPETDAAFAEILRAFGRAGWKQDPDPQRPQRCFLTKGALHLELYFHEKRLYIYGWGRTVIDEEDIEFDVPELSFTLDDLAQDMVTAMEDAAEAARPSAVDAWPEEYARKEALAEDQLRDSIVNSWLG